MDRLERLSRWTGHSQPSGGARLLSAASAHPAARDQQHPAEIRAHPVEIYLPIAEQSMNVFVLLALGAAAGLLAGMFGVGGGFLATPLLIFVGIPPAVAVAS